MADAVVVVARQAEGVAQPAEQRHLGIGVVPADHENDRVDQNQNVHEVGEPEAWIERNQDHARDDRRQHLQDPGEVVVRLVARPCQDRHSDGEQQPVQAIAIRARHVLSSLRVHARSPPPQCTSSTFSSTRRPSRRASLLRARISLSRCVDCWSMPAISIHSPSRPETTVCTRWTFVAPVTGERNESAAVEISKCHGVAGEARHHVEAGVHILEAGRVDDAPAVGRVHHLAAAHRHGLPHPDERAAALQHLDLLRHSIRCSGPRC